MKNIIKKFIIILLSIPFFLVTIIGVSFLSTGYSDSHAIVLMLVITIPFLIGDIWSRK